MAANGGAANGEADRPMISGNGRYVTFDSNATNLVAGVSHPERRTYRHDLTTGATEMVSVGSGGAHAGAWSSFTWPSDDGNLVAFVSDDMTLTTSPAARARSVYVRNMSARTTEMVSVNSAGQAANGASSRPMVTADGRFVAFSSYATNLTPAGGNGQEQLYLRDRVAGTTRLVSTTTGGGLGNQRSYRGMVSEDGRYVAFASFATNLLNDGGPQTESIFIRDMVAGVTTRVSVNAAGRPAPLGGSRPYISPNGAKVIYNTYDASVASDANGKSDVYLRDVRTNDLSLVSATPAGASASDESLRGFLTDDATQAVFNSFAGDLVPNDSKAYGDVFLRDLTTGKNTVLSVSWSGGGADQQSYRPVPSNDGSRVVFQSRARNLVRNDPSSPGWQIYVVSPASLVAQPDAAAPQVQVTTPAARQATTSPVTFSGSATDDRGVAAVYVQVRDQATELWLRPDGTWGAGARRLTTTLSSPQEATTQWSLRLALPEGQYGFDVQAVDTAGKASTKPWTPFSVSDTPTTGPDTTAPSISASSPAAAATVASPVSFSGQAQDNVGVTRAFIQVRNNDTNQWLRPDGTWQATAIRIPLDLAAAGAASTGWSKQLQLPSGKYGFDVVAIDAAGNLSPKPWRSFTVAGTAAVEADTSSASIRAEIPAAGATVTSPVSFTGDAEDNVGVTRAYIQVRDNATNLWLRPDGTWAEGAARLAVTLAEPNAPATDWSTELQLPSGKYGFDVVAFDDAGNRSEKPWRTFTVAE